MKLETNTEQFFSAISVAARFVERRANLPVLTSILLIAESGRVLLRATNLECGVEITVQAKVTEQGVAAVPANTLLGFLSNTKDKSISLEHKGGVVEIKTNHTTASIKTLPPEDFPILPRVSATSSFTTKASDFARAIRSVAYCASTSAIKPELQSILLFGNAGKLSAAATDSFRLAEKTIPLRSAGGVPSILIPARNATELMRILEGHQGDVEMYYDENQLATHVDSLYFTTRLIDGSFPNYQQIIPKTFTTEVVLLREDLSLSLKSLSVFSDKFSHLSMSTEPKKKEVTLTSRNPDVGEQVSSIQATISGEALTMSFNSRYLGDALQSITGESIRIEANGVGKPMLMKDAAENSFLYLVMPMNR